MWLGEGGEGGIIHLSILDEKAEDKKEKERWGGDMGLVVVSQWSSCYVVSLYWVSFFLSFFVLHSLKYHQIDYKKKSGKTKRCSFFK